MVEVRSPAAILATLDNGGGLDGVPFMPEMLQYVGRRFTVSRRVEKICDTIAATGSRRMRDTVYLEDLRCDGSGHGGCQAGCLIYWKEAWLQRVDGDSDGVDTTEDHRLELEQLAQSGTRTVREIEGEQQDVWRCQATEAFRASDPLKTSDVRQYWRELMSRNVGLLRFLGVAARGFVMEVASRVRLIGPTPLQGKNIQPAAQYWQEYRNGDVGLLRFLRVTARRLVMAVASRFRLIGPTPLQGEGIRPAAAEPLDLQPGDLVQVRSAAEIANTLDAKGFNRRLSFDREMLRYCGRKYRVIDRVERIIDDRTGRMLDISGDCLILGGVVCSGERSVGRWFCPRQIYPYWREAWLRRVEEPGSSG